MRYNTLEEAIIRIKELEAEISRLRAENDVLRSRSAAGRRKHDEKWTNSYNDFAVKYESGMSVMEIVGEGGISRRTAYRYLKWYREQNK